MKLYLRKAAIGDLDMMMSIIDHAREVIIKRGIPQWQDGDGPSREIFTEDIKREQAYVLMLDDQIVGVGTILTEPDEAYDKMKTWNMEFSGYASIHRVAINPDIQGRGLSKMLLSFLITAARLNGYQDIRIDTHPENKIMQHVIQSSGFQLKGEIELSVPNGERLAYQLILS